MKNFKNILSVFVILFLLKTDLFADQTDWVNIQKKSKDCVVQIFSNIDIINIFEPNKTPEQTAACGTGFFINSDAYLVTNFHVISGAVSLYIQIPCLSKDRFQFEVVGCNPDSDIAVLRPTEKAYKDLKNKFKNILNYESIPYLEFAESDNLLSSEEIMALGYPVAQENLKSSLGNISGFQDLQGRTSIQTTAAINPGNSGGPFLNSAGKVVGVIFAGILAAQNIGYVIPISGVKNLINNIVYGKYSSKVIRYPFWGFVYNYTTEDTNKYLNNPTDGGVIITKVFQQSIFDKSGIKSGDLLYKINGCFIDNYGYLRVKWCEYPLTVLDFLDRFDFDSSVDFTIYRNGQELNIKATVEQGSPLKIREIFNQFEKLDYEIIGGMIVSELTLNHISLQKECLKDLIKESGEYMILSTFKYNFAENMFNPKLFITKVYQDSAIANSKINLAGQIIEKINGQTVATLSDFRQAVLESKKTGYFTIETESGLFGAIPLKDIIEQEDNLASRYHYNKSKLFEVLA